MSFDRPPRRAGVTVRMQLQVGSRFGPTSARVQPCRPRDRQTTCTRVTARNEVPGSSSIRRPTASMSVSPGQLQGEVVQAGAVADRRGVLAGHGQREQMAPGAELDRAVDVGCVEPDQVLLQS